MGRLPPDQHTLPATRGSFGRRLGRAVSGAPARSGAAHAFRVSSFTSVVQNLASLTSWGSRGLHDIGDAFEQKLEPCRDAELVATCGPKVRHDCGSRAASLGPRACATAWVVL